MFKITGCFNLAIISPAALFEIVREDIGGSLRCGARSDAAGL